MGSPNSALMATGRAIPLANPNPANDASPLSGVSIELYELVLRAMGGWGMIDLTRTGSPGTGRNYQFNQNVNAAFSPGSFTVPQAQIYDPVAANWVSITPALMANSMVGKADAAVVSAAVDAAAGNTKWRAGGWAQSDITGLASALSAKEATANKGVANGYAGLDGSGKVPTSQLPSSIMGGLTFQGTWNATTNSPALASSTGTQGWIYIVATAGTTSLNGLNSWNIGDWAIYDGSVWRKVDGLATEVISIAGLTGAITASAMKTALAIASGDVSGLAASATTDTTNASNISSGTLAAARGGAGAINGLLKSNGAGVVSLAVAGTDYQAPGSSGAMALLTNGSFSGSSILDINISTYIATYRWIKIVLYDVLVTGDGLNMRLSNSGTASFNTGGNYNYSATFVDVGPAVNNYTLTSQTSFDLTCGHALSGSQPYGIWEVDLFDCNNAATKQSMRYRGGQGTAGAAAMNGQGHLNVAQVTQGVRFLNFGGPTNWTCVYAVYGML